MCVHFKMLYPVKEHFLLYKQVPFFGSLEEFRSAFQFRRANSTGKNLGFLDSCQEIKPACDSTKIHQTEDVSMIYFGFNKLAFSNETEFRWKIADQL